MLGVCENTFELLKIIYSILCSKGLDVQLSKKEVIKMEKNRSSVSSLHHDKAVMKLVLPLMIDYN